MKRRCIRSCVSDIALITLSSVHPSTTSISWTLPVGRHLHSACERAASPIFGPPLRLHRADTAPLRPSSIGHYSRRDRAHQLNCPTEKLPPPALGKNSPRPRLFAGHYRVRRQRRQCATIAAGVAFVPLDAASRRPGRTEPRRPSALISHHAVEQWPSIDPRIHF